MSHLTLSPRRAAILFSLSALLAACALMSGSDPATPTAPAIAPTTAAPAPTGVVLSPAVPPSPTPPPLTIVFVGQVAGARPGSVAALALQGAQVAASAHSAQLEVLDVDAPGADSPEALLRQVAGAGPALVIAAGIDLAEAARSAAEAFPAVRFLGVDQPAVESPANYQVVGDPGNRLDQEGFLSGMLAGMVTEARKVGIVVVGGTLEGRLYANGFLHGVRLTCGDCEVRTIEIASPSDLAEGEGTAARLETVSVDVMVAAAGAAGEAGLKAATPLGMRVIGLGHDHAAVSGGDPLVAGSVIRRPDLILPDVVAALLAGETPEHRAFALDTGGLSLAETFGPDVSPAMINVIGDTLPHLASGLLDTGVDLTTGEEQ